MMDGFGPNDSQVLKFLAQVARMTLDQAREVVRLRAAADDEARRHAVWAVDRAALMSGRTEVLESARDAIRVSARLRGNPWFGRANRVYWRRFSLQNAETMSAALPALLDAIGALVVRDLLEPPAFEVLYSPWNAALALVGSAAAAGDRGFGSAPAQ
jgi:hypothetical protein